MVEYFEEIAELDRPRTWTVRSIGGLPVNAIAQCAIEPLDSGERSRITIRLDFKARGMGDCFFRSSFVDRRGRPFRKRRAS